VKFRDFLLGIFCEPATDGLAGKPSFSRIATAVVISFGCGWVTAIVRYTHVLPDFAGLIGFIGVPYGINKASAAFGPPKA